MKSLFLMIAAAGCLTAVSATVTTASAEVVRKTVVTHHGEFGHGCRTVRTVSRGPGGRRVVVRKICR